MSYICGRYDLNSPPIKLKTRFQTDFGRIAQELSPRYNIAPSMRVPAVRNEDGEGRAAMTTWGLVPRWAKDLSGIKPINARGVSIADKPMFRDAFKRRRYLIPADGFYVWKRSAGGQGTVRDGGDLGRIGRGRGRNCKPAPSSPSAPTN